MWRATSSSPTSAADAGELHSFLVAQLRFAERRRWLADDGTDRNV